MQSKIIKFGGGNCLALAPQHFAPQLADFARLPRITAETEADIVVRLNELIDQTRTMADGIIADAMAQVDSIKAQAHEEGYASGYSEGFAAGSEKAAEHATALIENLDLDLAEIERIRTDEIHLVEEDMLKLVLIIAEKVIRHEARTDSRIVIRAIESVLKRTTLAQEVCVRVNPSEVELVRSSRDDLLSMAEGIRSLTVREDRRVPAGGCVVESDAGFFDATINTQIKKIKRSLLEVCETSQEPGRM